MTDETGVPLANYVYDAWGNFTLSPASQSVSNQDLAYISAYNPVTYRGYLYDPELGWYYLQSRYYDPETCRFLNADAVIDSGKSALGANRFSYCYSSPVVMVDSDGNKPILFFSKYGVDINLMEEAEEYSKYQIEGVVSTYSIIPPLPISEMPIFRNNIKINTIEYVVQLFLEMEKAMENDTEEEAENKFIQNCSYWHAFIQQSNYVRLLMKD